MNKRTDERSDEFAVVI